MARDCQSGGSARSKRSSNNIDNLVYCLRWGCDARLTEVEGCYEDLTIHYECRDGHKGAKCVTELARPEC